MLAFVAGKAAPHALCGMIQAIFVVIAVEIPNAPTFLALHGAGKSLVHLHHLQQGILCEDFHGGGAPFPLWLCYGFSRFGPSCLLVAGSFAQLAEQKQSAGERQPGTG